MEARYTAVATATGDGRNGHVATEAGTLDLEVRVPKEMGGPGGATNPEELFASGFAACFHSALKYVGRDVKADLSGSEVRAAVAIGNLDNGGYGLAVELTVHAPALGHDAALSLAEKADAVCPYSNATRDNVEVTLRIA